MARNRSGPRREFVWARSVGMVTGTTAPGSVSVGAADLLESVRVDYGEGILRGATVMAIKGWVRPFVPATSRVTGVAGIRVCNYGDLALPTTVDQTPGGPVGQEADWMGYFPYDVDQGGTELSSANSPATWNMGASLWTIDVQSHRKFEALGQTLGFFYYNTAVVGTPESVASVDYHVSVGLKLA